MKKSLLALLLIFSVCSLCYGQRLKGRYMNGDRYLIFSGDSLRYLINSGGGIVFVFNGAAAYSIKHGKLFVKPSPEKNAPSAFSKVEPNNVNDCLITVSAAHGGRMVIGASVSAFKDGRLLYDNATDINGQVRFPRSRLAAIDSIAVTILGYKTAGLKISPAEKADFKVALTEGTDLKAEINFFSNKGKGLPIKIKPGAVLLQLPHARNAKAQWIVFKKTSGGIL